jgi:hypothetical protein
MPDTLPETASSASIPTSSRLAARFLGSVEKHRLTGLIRSGDLRLVRDIELLAPEQLPQVARRGLWLLLGSGVFFIALDLIARSSQPSSPLFGVGGVGAVALLIVLNILGYALIIPIHEGVHALIIVALGGRPRFGVRWPLAAYCTAPNQLFTRNGYIAVALAPLIALTIAGVLVTWLFPDAGAAIVLAMAGNISGAIGDLVAVDGLRRLPPSTLIADTATGFLAYEPVS